MSDEQRDDELSLQLQIDDLCNQFESEMKNGRTPLLRGFLRQVDGPGQDRLLEELLAVLFEVDQRSDRERELSQIQQECPGKSALILNAYVRAQQAAAEEDQLTKTIDHRPAELRESLTGEELLKARYQIEEEVARGGMGVVYRARHRMLNMPAAVKMILPGASTDRFLREGRLLASINSPHVIRIYDFDVLQDQRQLICMEWVEGSDLGMRMNAMPKQRIPEHQALIWMRQTAQGMADAAKVGITHRDLKPSNILIDENGNARVADFGLARSPHEAIAKSASGDLLGTPYYMSPEQAEDPQRVDTRSDIYSFGATFYHALTGTVPFDGPSIFSILFKHKTETLLSPRAHCDELSESICQILERCLAKSPNDRFQSFAELAVHLEQLSKIGFHWDDVHDQWLGSHLERYQSRREDYLAGRFEWDEYCFSESRKLRIVRENIVDQRVDVIVSSDDSHLTMGGGVSSALAEKAGGDFISEARAYTPVRPGRVIVTRAGDLPVRFVFHAITIGYKPDSIQLPSRDIIAELINGCFYHAETLGVRSIAFPLLGAGAAGFSRETCLDIMFRIVARKLLHGVTCVEEARIVSMETRQAALEWYARIQSRRIDDDLGTVNSLVQTATSAASSLHDTKVDESNGEAEQESLDAKAKSKRAERAAEDVLQNFKLSVASDQMAGDWRFVEVPEIEGYEFFRFHLPTLKGGGDYYDFFPLPDDRYCVIVGDIAGYCISQKTVDHLRSEIRANLRHFEDPADAVAEVNRRLHEGDSGRFVTLAVIVLDLKKHTGLIVCAGHYPPIVRRANGNVERLDVQADIPVGVHETAEYHATPVALAPGESLIMTTDGVDEARNIAGEMYSVPRVLQHVADSNGTPTDIGKKLLHDLNAFLDCPPDDDMCIICVGRSK